MRRLVVLCRHGNTFNTGERVFMVGAREDLPLTQVGTEQGRLVGRALRAAGCVVTELRAGPLRRTADFAALISSEAAAAVTTVIDERLKELDFGRWSGLSDSEIERLSGADALKRWREEGIRPEGIGFSPSVQEVEQEVRGVLTDLARGDGLAVVVTSNGRLREFARLISETHDRAGRVRTGGSCLVAFDKGAWRIIDWDVKPEELEALLKKEATSTSR